MTQEIVAIIIAVFLNGFVVTMILNYFLNE